MFACINMAYGNAKIFGHAFVTGVLRALNAVVCIYSMSNIHIYSKTVNCIYDIQEAAYAKAINSQRSCVRIKRIGKILWKIF